jgi:hypothetical protein
MSRVKNIKLLTQRPTPGTLQKFCFLIKSRKPEYFWGKKHSNLTRFRILKCFLWDNVVQNEVQSGAAVN